MAKKKMNFSGKLKSNAEAQKRTGGGVGYLRVPEGMNQFKLDHKNANKCQTKFDIIPYIVTNKKHLDLNTEEQIAVKGDMWYKSPFLLHRSLGDNKRQFAVCPRTFGKTCPICNYRDAGWEKYTDGGYIDPEIKKVLVSMFPQKRTLYYLLPHDGVDNPKTIHIFDTSDATFQLKLNEEISENEDAENFPDLTDGKTLNVRWTPKEMGKNQKFLEASRIDFLERAKPIKESIVDGLPSLDELLTVLSEEELSNLLRGIEIDDEPVDSDDAPWEEDEDDVDESKWQKKEDEEVEDDDEVEEEEEEEEDAPPPKKNKSKKETKKVTEKKEKTKSAKGKCPNGFTFGVDAFDYPECDDCAVSDECLRD